MTHETVELDYNGVKLRGDLYVPATSEVRQAVLFLHGWTGKSNTHAAEFLAKHGYMAMTINLPGHNNSEGNIHTLTRVEAREASLLAFDFLASRLGPNGQMTVAGNSFGGYIAALLTTERPVSGVSLRVPANYPDEGMDRPQYGKGNDDPAVAQWRRQVHDPETTASLRAINNFVGKLQIIQAGDDDRIPVQVIESYRGAVRNKDLLEYHFMPDWPHSLGGDPERNKVFQALLLHWLKAL